MEEENRSPRKNWDFMIGIALVLFGSFRLYQRLQAETEWDYRAILTILFIGYGGFLIYRHFQSTDNN
ncbi:hypothetical protein [Aquimarina sp. 2201CG14-23]|uniref:hypothetical protein n=1 Tax=Aquimarina mycalae TaxID=3040073 RepID=UPI0024780ECC|nr:hypothetical protein [Aquimarina sp. 2201CG14-23]MDH7444049.1 hypothetical protein [Aquimarina sp. 2201CG14-23]